MHKNSNKPLQWHHPADVMKLHKLKLKKKALQARITCESSKVDTKIANKATNFEDVLSAKKRKNPFVKSNDNDNKRHKSEVTLEESTDQTLFKLLHQSSTSIPIQPSSAVTTFENILSKVNNDNQVVLVKAERELHAPIDWSLKAKMRLFSTKPFAWNQKLKLNEESSGTTGFVRCLESSSTTNLDTSPNAKFYQCCMFWQQPSFPWLKLFPRTTGKASDSGGSMATNAVIKNSLQTAFSDSFRSLFQLIRTKQCPYFYLCSNTFTVLFRAAGICGISEVHALITPTTRGFRHMLRQADIEFTMPLKSKRVSDQGYDTIDSILSDTDNAKLEEDEEEPPDEQWLKSMGINAEDIKQINYTQAKIEQKAECRVDNSEQSLILVEGVEVHALYNFLINCKSATASTGPLAGIPPTLLAPVAFNGATLQALTVKESKVHLDNTDFFSQEIIGPILPSTIHNILSINSPQHSMSASFVSVPSTSPFNKVREIRTEGSDVTKGNMIFNKENLSDCGLTKEILELFCKPDGSIASVECLKYNSDSQSYTWT